MNIYQPGSSICYGPDFALHGEVHTVNITRGDKVQYEVTRIKKREIVSAKNRSIEIIRG